MLFVAGVRTALTHDVCAQVLQAVSKDGYGIALAGLLGGKLLKKKLEAIIGQPPSVSVPR